MTQAIDLNGMTLTRIVEQEGPFFDPFAFLPRWTKELSEENRHWLEPSYIDPVTKNLILCVQSYIIRTQHHTILIDSCVGNDKSRPTIPFWDRMASSTYMDGLAAAGIRVEEIDFVLCTHLHVDHVGWNTRLDNGRWVPTFPNARYVFSEKELAFWTEQNSATPLPWIEDSVLPIVAAGRTDLVTSDHALNDHVRLMPTPGHTPDHFAVRLGATGDDAVIAGDLIHSPLQARYPEISMAFDYDQALSARTRRDFLESCCDTSTLVCPAHFPSPSMGRITRWGDGFRFRFVE